MSTLDEFDEDDEETLSKAKEKREQQKPPTVKSTAAPPKIGLTSLSEASLQNKKTGNTPLRDSLEFKKNRIISPEIKSMIHGLIAEEFIKFKADVYANLSIPKEAPTNQDTLNRVLGLLNWEVLITKINALADDDYLKMTLPAPKPSKTTPGKGKVHRRLKHITINLLELIRAEVTTIFSEI